MGGVEICSTCASRRTPDSGLEWIPGCTNLDGSMALAYARSRYYEEWIDDDWRLQRVRDGTADLGRIQRQQAFIRLAADKLLATMESDPFKLGQLIEGGHHVVKVDDSIDVSKRATPSRGRGGRPRHVQPPRRAPSTATRRSAAARGEPKPSSTTSGAVRNHPPRRRRRRRRHGERTGGSCRGRASMT